MTTRRGGRGGRTDRPALVVPAEEVPPEVAEDLGLARGPVGSSVNGSGDNAERRVGRVSGGRKRFAGADKLVPVTFRMDPAVNYAMRIMLLETGLEQQYLINLAVKEFCQRQGVDPEALRGGKGYTFSYPGAGEEE